MHALSELLSEGEPLARKSPGALAALARRLLRTATHLATRLRGNAWLAMQTRDRAVALGPLQRPGCGRVRSPPDCARPRSVCRALRPVRRKRCRR